MRKGLRLGVDDEVDLALTMQRDVLGTVARHCRESEPLEQRAQQLRIRSGVLDEFESVGSHRVVRQSAHEPTLRAVRARLRCADTDYSRR